MAIDDPLAVSFALVAATVGGLWLIRRGFELRKQRELIEETPTADVESVSIGPAELTGTARPLDEPITAPFSDDECLVAVWEVEEWQETDDNDYWQTVDEGVDFTPFVLDDDTGEIRVDPQSSAEFVIERDAEDVRRVDVGTTPPQRIREFVDCQDTVGDPTNVFAAVDLGNKEGDRRYRQNLLEPGQDAYVYGAVRADERSNDASPIVGPPTESVDAGMFMISDVSEDRLLDRRDWALLWRLPVGALLTALGIGGLYVVVPTIF